MRRTLPYLTAALLSVAPLGVFGAAAEPLNVRFQPAVNVSNAEGLSDAPAIVTDVDGRMFVAWEERLLELASLGANDVRTVFAAFDFYYGGAEIVYAGSMNGGENFSEPVLLSPIDNFNSYAPDVAAGWGMAVAWTDFDVWTGVTEIQVRASTDGAATFNLSSIPQPSYPPRMVTDESGRLYVLWEEGDYLVDMKLFLAVSTDDGSSFGTPLLLAGPTADVRGDLAVLSDGALLVASLERADGGS